MKNYDDSLVDETILKVIGAGFCRTGTSSLKDALNILGFHCYHFDEMLINKQEDIWLDVLQGKSVEWKDIFNGYIATVDYPSVKYYKELMAAYPQAKIILTVRDFESWYNSCMETLYYAYKKLRSRPSTPPKLIEVSQLAIWEGTFNGKFEDKKYAMKIYESHIKEVKRFVGAEKLLVFDVKEGWSPLCNFLGVPVPAKDVNFPNSNDKISFLNRFELRFGSE